MFRTEPAMLPWPCLLAGAFGLMSCGDMAPPAYIGPASDHFDGRRFHNPSGAEAKGWLDLARWKWSAEPGPWDEFTDARPGAAPPRRVKEGELRVTFVNHATLLVQIDGLNILTDPIWSERSSPVSWLGPKRVRPPGIRFEDLPPIDVVLISHNHFDHLDLPTLERLASTFRPRFVVPLGNHDLLAERQISRVQELDWWQSFKLAELTRVSAVPAQHFSQRGFYDRDASLWAGFVIESPAGTVYFAGDTAWGPHFEQIRQRFGPPRLALLPIGMFEPEWFMLPIHMSPEQALQAHTVLQPEASVAMHFGTFQLADDGQREPQERLLAAIAKAGEPAPRFWVLEFGEGRDLPVRELADAGDAALAAGEADAGAPAE